MRDNELDTLQPLPARATMADPWVATGYASPVICRLLPLCILLFAHCDCSSDRGSGTGAPSDSSTTPDGPLACMGTRCSGDMFERCVAGEWTTEATCGGGQVCHEEFGCIDPDPCTLAELERSNVGCEYFSVDLPQPRFSSWPIPLGFPWRAQFGVAVSNPNPEAVTVRVERNDAAPGMGESISMVAEVSVPGNSVQLLPLETREVNGVSSDDAAPSARSHSAITNHAYRITSTLPIVAYQFNPLANQSVFSDDASLLVPAHSLDESYLAIGWPGRNESEGLVPSDNRPFLSIVAVRGPTRVRVVPTIPIQEGNGVVATPAGTPLEVLLDRFGVLNVQGDGVSGTEIDFTGTIIEADQPISVFSGVEANTISPPGQNYGNADHLEEQLVPRSALGREHVIVRSAPRRPASVGPPEEDYIKVLSLVDGTQVTTSLGGDDATFALNRGEHRLIFTAESFTLDASEPVVVAQFLLSGESIRPEVIDPFSGDVTQEGLLIGDPSFMNVPPLEQFRQQYRFLVPDGYETDYALIAAPAGTQITEDGSSVSCRRAPIGEIGGQMWEALHCELTDGAHHFEADTPFSLIVEGWGPDVVSYGYTGGMDFEPINEECSTDDECAGGEFCSGGYCTDEIILI